MSSCLTKSGATILRLIYCSSKTNEDTFHGTCNVALGKTTDRKKTSQSRIKPDNMQLALHHIQQRSSRKNILKNKNHWPSKTTPWHLPVSVKVNMRYPILITNLDLKALNIANCNWIYSPLFPSCLIGPFFRVSELHFLSESWDIFWRSIRSMNQASVRHEATFIVWDGCAWLWLI